MTSGRLASRSSSKPSAVNDSLSATALVRGFPSRSWPPSQAPGGVNCSSQLYGEKIANNPPRFTKDVGRAIALWWLAREQSSEAAEQWAEEWRDCLATLYPSNNSNMRSAARIGLRSVADYLSVAHAIARSGVLAPHGTTLEAFRRAHLSLLDLIEGS